jgi:hypothetical protein
MLEPSDVAPERWQETGPFAVCETTAEIVVAVHQLLGLDGVDQFLVAAKPHCTREALREAADELRLVGMKDLAALVRKHARRAKPAPMTFKKRWQHRFARN